MYLSRRMGVGSSVSIMHWEVRPHHHAVTYAGAVITVYQISAHAWHSVHLSRDWTNALRSFCFRLHAMGLQDVNSHVCSMQMGQPVGACLAFCRSQSFGHGLCDVAYPSHVLTAYALLAVCFLQHGALPYMTLWIKLTQSV